MQYDYKHHNRNSWKLSRSSTYDFKVKSYMFEDVYKV